MIYQHYISDNVEVLNKRILTLKEVFMPNSKNMEDIREYKWDYIVSLPHRHVEMKVINNQVSIKLNSEYTVNCQYLDFNDLPTFFIVPASFYQLDSDISFFEPDEEIVDKLWGAQLLEWCKKYYTISESVNQIYNIILAIYVNMVKAGDIIRENTLNILSCEENDSVFIPYDDVPEEIIYELKRQFMEEYFVEIFESYIVNYANHIIKEIGIELKEGERLLDIYNNDRVVRSKINEIINKHIENKWNKLEKNEEFRHKVAVTFNNKLLHADENCKYNKILNTLYQNQLFYDVSLVVEINNRAKEFITKAFHAIRDTKGFINWLNGYFNFYDPFRILEVGIYDSDQELVDSDMCYANFGKLLEFKIEYNNYDINKNNINFDIHTIKFDCVAPNYTHIYKKIKILIIVYLNNRRLKLLFDNSRFLFYIVRRIWNIYKYINSFVSICNKLENYPLIGSVLALGKSLRSPTRS